MRQKISGQVDMVKGFGTVSVVADRRGLPVVIVSSFGRTKYKLGCQSARVGSRERPYRKRALGTLVKRALTEFLQKVQARKSSSS